MNGTGPGHGISEISGKQYPLTDDSVIHLFMKAGEDEGAALFYL
jgi:hypothetical protein